jgi:gluconolactonase
MNWRSQLFIPVLLTGLACISCTAQQLPYFTGSVDRLDPALDLIIAPGTRPEVIAEGFDWSEGPLWLPGLESLVFSDIPKNIVYRWSQEEGLVPYLEPSGYTGEVPRGGELGSNGLLLDPEGHLVLCQHGDRRMARMESDLEHPRAAFTTLADRWEGKRFNSPNDAVYRKNGDLYFTDPAYGMEQGYRDPGREMDFTGVFLLKPDGKVSLLTNRLSAPNGIGLSPDENSLYVANSGGPSGPVWMIYDLAQEGTLENARIFYDASAASDTLRGGPDGLAVRDDGTVFATGPGGIWIFHSSGTPLGIIHTGQATSNCTLDSGGKTLYMTADMYLMRISLL